MVKFISLLICMEKLNVSVRSHTVHTSDIRLRIGHHTYERRQRHTVLEDVVTSVPENVDSQGQLVVKELGVDTKIRLLRYFPFQVVGSGVGFCDTRITVSPSRSGVIVYQGQVREASLAGIIVGGNNLVVSYNTVRAAKFRGT